MPFRYVSRQAQMIRSFYSGIGKTAVIFPAAFLGSVAWGTLALGLVFYLREIYEATGSQIGAFVGLWYFCYILGCLLVRPLTDRIRPRYLLPAASFAACLLALAVHCGGSFILAFVFCGLLGISTALFWPPLMGWLSSELEGPQLSKVMSRFNLSWSMGAIISPYLAGWLSERNTVLPIYAASGFFLLTSFLVAGAALALPRVRDDRYSAGRSQDTGTGEDKSTLLRYSAWVGLFTAWVVLGVIVSIFPVSAREDLHISKSVIGMLLLSRALFTTVGFGIMGRTTFWHYRPSQMLLGQLCIAGCLVAMTYASHPLTIGPVLALMGLFIALSYSNSLFHGIAGSVNRAARSAVHESLLSAGLISGSLLGGIVYQHYSISVAYLLCAGVVLTGVFVQVGISIRVSFPKTSSSSLMTQSRAVPDSRRPLPRYENHRHASIRSRKP